MSNALAIAGVTHVLKDLLNDGIIQGDLGATVGAKVAVTARPPLRQPDTSDPDKCQLNLFLYQVQPNQGWRNERLPARDAAGARVGRPPLALDLYYLLTAYDERDLHPEILLGYAMQLLHESPLLNRKAIRRSLKDISEPGAGTLPPELKALTQAGLADQLESLKITPYYLNTEETSKLWTGLQAPYRPSVAYVVTVVLIESAGPTRSALPVLTIGAEDRGVVVQAAMLAPYPTLLTLRAADFQPVARHDGILHLFGHHLAGANPVVILKHPGLGLELTITGNDAVPTNPVRITPTPTRTELSQSGTTGETFELSDDILLQSDRRIQVDLSQAQPAASWAPGVITLEFLISQTDAQNVTTGRTSNTLPLAVAPMIRFGGADNPVVTADASTNGFRATTIRLKCRPSVWQGQSLSLIVGDRELVGAGDFPPPGPDPGPLRSTDTLEFKGRLPEAMFVPPGRHPVRLRVDGIESILIERFQPPKPPVFDSSQQINLLA